MTRHLRVLHVITAFDRGGAENHLADLVRYQQKIGMDVTVAYLRGRGSLAPAMRELGVAVHDLGLRFYGDLRSLQRLRQLIARGAFQLVHAHLPPAELYVRLALLGTTATALPLIISKHNDCPFHRVPGERLVERWVARRAGAVIAISEAVHRFMTARGVGTGAGQMQTIPYGIDAAPYQQAEPDSVMELRKTWGADPDTLIIGFVGRLVEQKSIDTLIRGFSRFRREEPRNTRLVIVGDGPLLAELKDCVKEHGVSSWVTWAGFREDIPLVMQTMDILALTSIFEGFGLVLVEAMAAHRPVVASRVSAIPEVVIDGETGMLTEPRAWEAVSEAFLQLADLANRRRMGEAGYRRVLEHFTLDRMCNSTDEVYARCLDAIPGGSQAHKRLSSCRAN